MALSQQNIKRKASGGRLRKFRDKKHFAIARAPSLTKLAPTKLVQKRVLGGNMKSMLLDADVANVLDPKTKKFQKAKILTILENPANRHFVRRNIMTKGTIINTEAGKARITSRPGQDGTVNAVLV